MRHRIASTLAALAIVGAVGASHHQSYAQAQSGPVPERISAIVHRTQIVGWPHPPSVREAAQVMRAVLNLTTPRRWSGRIYCFWPKPNVGGARCTVRIASPGPKVIKRKFTVRFRAFEDGSWYIF